MRVRTVISGPDECLVLGNKATPEALARLLGPPSHSWDDGIECCMEYSTSLGTISFMFAHYRFLFGPEKFKLITVELNSSRRQSETPASRVLKVQVDKGR